MPTSIVPQDQDGQDVYNAISSFFFKFEVGNLLRKCNAQKEKGVPVLDIFKYKFCNPLIFITANYIVTELFCYFL
jgi:hypothetical protein